jgi:tight adherence protein B
MAFFAVLFVAVWLGAILAGWLAWTARRNANRGRIKDRLLGGARAKAKTQKGPALIETEERNRGKLVVELLQRFELRERLKALIEQAGLKWHPVRLIHACLVLFLAACALWIRAAPGYRGWCIIPGLLVGALPILHVLRKRRTRLKLFEEQFPESLEFVARSMRAGHAFSVSLEMIHSEFQDPLAGEFRRTFDEQNLGLPLDLALQKLAQRVPLMDVHFFVSAVLLQKRTGGNLAELLDKLAYLIRERFKLRGRIRAISAHGRMTGMVLSMIPAAVGMIMYYVNPSYARFFLDDPTGRQMLLSAVGLQILGYLVIQKIVSIEV